jgi:uncharacterized protein YdcH (DUF465 family)
VDHEYEQFKKRYAELEQKLNEKSAAYDALLDASNSQQERIKNLEARNETLTNNLTAHQANESRSIYDDISVADHLFMASSCVGVLRDRLSQGPMDKKNFEHEVDLFVDQAMVLYQKLTSTRLKGFFTPIFNHNSPRKGSFFFLENKC